MDKQEELTEEQKEKLADSYLGDDFPEEVVLEYISQTGDDDLSDIEEAYAGKFNDDKEFAQDMADSTGSVDFRNQPWPQYCIDWEYAAKELMYDYFAIDDSNRDRYYFRNL